MLAFSLAAAATEAGWDITADHHEHLNSQIHNHNKREQSKLLCGIREAR